MYRRSIGIGFVFGAVALFGEEASAQWDRYRKSSTNIRESFRPVTEKNRDAVVTVLRDGDPCALGCLVHREGWVLTKGSELYGELTIRLADGRTMEVVDVARETTCDLGVVRLGGDFAISPVSFARDGSANVGQLLAALSGEDLPLAVGVIGAPAREVPRERGLLGVMLGTVDGLPTVTDVLPRTTAELVGLQEGDRIVQVDGQRYRDHRSLVDNLRHASVGDAVELEIQRGEETLRLTAELGSSAQEADTMNGPLSRVRSGFERAFPHDCIVHPDECGGPLVDLSGDVVAVNIARAGRTGCLAIPASKVQEILPKLMSKGTGARRY